MGWLQILAIILLTIKLTGSAFMHGKLIEVKFGTSLFNVAIWSAILYYGGFFRV